MTLEEKIKNYLTDPWPKVPVLKEDLREMLTALQTLEWEIRTLKKKAPDETWATSPPETLRELAIEESLPGAPQRHTDEDSYLRKHAAYLDDGNWGDF